MEIWKSNRVQVPPEPVKPCLKPLILKRTLIPDPNTLHQPTNPFPRTSTPYLEHPEALSSWNSEAFKPSQQAYNTTCNTRFSKAPTNTLM